MLILCVMPDIVDPHYSVYIKRASGGKYYALSSTITMVKNLTSKTRHFSGAVKNKESGKNGCRKIQFRLLCLFDDNLKQRPFVPAELKQ